MDLLKRLDTWLAFFTLAAVGYYFGLRPLLDHFGIDVGALLRRLLGRAATVSSVSGGSLAHYGEPDARLAPEKVADGPGLSAGLSAGLPATPPMHPALHAIMLNNSADKDERAAATTRGALVRALIVAGWRTGEIRVLLRGDTTAVTDEIRAARIALGVGDEEVPRTPLAGRPIPPGVEFEDKAVTV